MPDNEARIESDGVVRATLNPEDYGKGAELKPLITTYLFSRQAPHPAGCFPYVLPVRFELTRLSREF